MLSTPKMVPQWGCSLSLRGILVCPRKDHFETQKPMGSGKEGSFVPSSQISTWLETTRNELILLPKQEVPFPILFFVCCCCCYYVFPHCCCTENPRQHCTKARGTALCWMWLTVCAYHSWVWLLPASVVPVAVWWILLSELRYVVLWGRCSTLCLIKALVEPPWCLTVCQKKDVLTYVRATCSGAVISIS